MNKDLRDICSKIDCEKLASKCSECQLEKIMVELRGYRKLEEYFQQTFNANLTIQELLAYWVLHIEKLEQEPLNGFRILTNEDALLYDRWKAERN